MLFVKLLCGSFLIRILVGTLCFIYFKAAVLYADTSYSFVALYNAEINSNSSAIQSDEVVASLGRKRRLFLSPEIGIKRRDTLIHAASWELAGYTVVAFQYGYLQYPDGFSHTKQMRTVNFVERTKVDETKVFFDFKLRLYSNVSKIIKPFAGLGYRYSYANFSFKLGDWALKDTVEDHSKEFNIGITIPIVKSRIAHQFECDIGFSEMNVRTGCGLSFNF